MKAVSADRVGSVDDYRLVEIEAPRLESGEVLIRVAACGIGYVDALLATGGYQVKPPTPFIPGHEVAGIVHAVGENVAGFSPGDRVIAMTGGGFAEMARAPAANTFVMPDGISFVDAASLPLNYLTAVHALRDRGRVKQGETVLVLGAAGGVGSSAVQVAKFLGARVIAAASSEDKRAYAIACGADAVLDTEPAGWRERLKTLTAGKLDVVFDPVCGPLFEPAFRSLSWRGRHLVIGFLGGIPSLAVNLPLMKGAALYGVDVRQYMEFEHARAMDDVRDILYWTSQHRIRPLVGEVFAFQSFNSAMRAALSGKGRGKVVLEVTALES